MSSEPPLIDCAFVCSFGGEIPAMNSEDLFTIAFDLMDLMAHADRDSPAAWREAVRVLQASRAPRMANGAAFLANEIAGAYMAEIAPRQRGPRPRVLTAEETEQVLKHRRFRRHGYRWISEQTGIPWRLVQKACEDNGV